MSELAVCLYGSKNSDPMITKEFCNSELGDKFHIHFYEYFENDDPLINLWTVNFNKRQYEIKNTKEYSVCLALNVNATNESLPIEKYLPLNDQLYYIMGGFDIPTQTTFISLSAFFANSYIFDMVCSFGLVKGKWQNLIKSRNIEEEFYFYLKTLKIKTGCINYENSSLFKWTT